MDPYCVVTLGNQKQKTRVASGAGKSPNWQDQLVFKRNFEDAFHIVVWDYDGNSSDDVVGEGYLLVQTALSRQNWEDWVELTYHGKRSGEVRISITFNPDMSQTNNPAYPPVPPQMMQTYSAYPPAYPPAYPAYPPAYQSPPAYQAYPPPQAYPQYIPPMPGYNPNPSYPNYPYPPNSSNPSPYQTYSAQSYPNNPNYSNTYGHYPPPHY